MDETGAAGILRFGRFELHRKTRELRKDGLRVHLQDQPFHVLALLLERPGDVVTREELRERLWPADTFVDFERGLNNAVRRLRNALGDSAELPRFVDTLPRVGYRFIAPVEGHGQAAPAPRVAGDVPPAPEGTHAEREERPAPSPITRRLLFAAAAAAMASVATVAVVLVRPRREEPPAIRPLTHSGHDFGPTVSPDGSLLAFASDRDGRRRIWLTRLSTGEETPLTSGPDDTEPRFSPDGSSILFTRVGSGVESLYRAPVQGGEPRRLLSPAGSGDWSPDGLRLAYATYVHGDRPAYALGVAAADGSEPREVALVEASWMSPPRWSPDGRLIAVTHAQSKAKAWSTLVVDPLTGQQRRLPPPGPPGALSAPVWSRGGRELLVLQSDDVHDWRGGRLLSQPLGSKPTETLLRFPAVGPGLDRAGAGRLVFDAREVRHHLREQPLFSDVAAWPRWLTRGQAADGQPAYSPDGQRVVFVSDRSGNLDLWEVSLASGRLRRLTDHPAEDVEPHVLRDSRILWASRRTGSFEIWMAGADGSDARQITRDGMDARNPLGMPDRGWILYIARQPQPGSLWKVRADGSEAAPLVPGPMALADVSPDGEHVLFAELKPSQTSLRVMAVAWLGFGGPELRLLPFQVDLAWKGMGQRDARVVEPIRRASFTADGRAVAFVDLDEAGRPRIYLQDFDARRDTSATRRPLSGFEPDLQVESFAVSPDGQRLAIAYRETSLHLMIAEGLGGGRP